MMTRGARALTTLFQGGFFGGTPARKIHIEARETINSAFREPISVILKTRHDKKTHEPYPHYLQRSLQELYQALPPGLTSHLLYLIKVNTSLIDPDLWNHYKAVLAISEGHIMSGIYHARENTLIPAEGTLTSWTPQGQEKEDHIYHQSLITSASRCDSFHSKGSTEFFWFTLFSELTLTIDACKKRLSNPTPKETYHLTQNACGQKVYEMATGKPGKEKWPTQTAALNTIFASLHPAAAPTLTPSFEHAAIKIFINHLAFTEGKIFLESEAGMKYLNSPNGQIFLKKKQELTHDLERKNRGGYLP